jgi:uncharacterized protein
MTTPNPLLDSPLTDEEVQELEEFLHEDRDEGEAMSFDIMDGYLHAVAIGPTPLLPRQWLPAICGELPGQGTVPAARDPEQFNRMLELVVRHFNSIIGALEDEPPDIFPIWSAIEFEGREWDDAEGWALGFVQGVELCRADWQPLLETEQGRAWYRPIGLLGEDHFCPEQDSLTDTPAQRSELSLQIPAAVLAMLAYWLPHRRALQEGTMASTPQAKVGRNERCPCGSGRKFKKCCGTPATLH